VLQHFFRSFARETPFSSERRKLIVLLRIALILSIFAVLILPEASTPPAKASEAGKIFPFDVHQTTLDNGLKIVVIPYDSPGIVAYFTVVRTGSREEVEPGHSGFAHFFEHMMFRGTERYSADAYNDVLKRLGADSNAFTTDDYTNYYIIGPSAELETMMDIESDRFENLEYSEEVFRTEALAVLGEYNKNASGPFLPMYEKMRDLAFQKHTYKHTTMGFLADIKAMPGYYEYSRRFFDRFYRPENVVLLIVGDVQPETTFQMAKKYYAGWKKGYKPAEIPEEAEQTKPETGEIDWPTPIRPHMMMAWHIPAFDPSSKDTAALQLVGQLLFSESAPLYQELVVDKQWVDFVSGGPDDHRDPYLFTVFTRVKSEDLVPKVQQAIAQHIDQLKEEPVDAERLARIKDHLRYDFALGLDSPGAVAFTVAQFLSLTGDPGSINELYAQYPKVEPKDIQRVAKKIFQDSERTVVTLSHKPAPQVPEVTTEGGER
jgi:zinc protease